jgi:hypothetical protein
MPLRVYNEKIKRINSQKERQNASMNFFEKKNYPNNKRIIACSDFLEHSDY